MDSVERNNDIHPFVRLALDAVRSYLENGCKINPPLDQYPELQQLAGVFVSFKLDGNLRGCIGTLEPTTGNMGDEIVQNAISSATNDTRFRPISIKEVDQLICSIDRLYEPELVRSVSELDPTAYGIIIRRNDLQALLLPNLQGVDTIDQQISIAKKKAGIAEDEYVEIYKFKTERYK